MQVHSREHVLGNIYVSTYDTLRFYSESYVRNSVRCTSDLWKGWNGVRFMVHLNHCRKFHGRWRIFVRRNSISFWPWMCWITVFYSKRYKLTNCVLWHRKKCSNKFLTLNYCEYTMLQWTARTVEGYCHCQSNISVIMKVFTVINAVFCQVYY